jgi:hypothetical protein
METSRRDIKRHVRHQATLGALRRQWATLRDRRDIHGRLIEFWIEFGGTLGELKGDNGQLWETHR